jgi:steroid delta-isomerase-like uncharacterized protein
MATSTKRKTKAQVTEEHVLSYAEAVSARDLDAMVAHMADDVIEDITPVGILRGTGEVREFLGELFAAFPDFQFTVEQSTASAQMCALQWRATGTFRGAPFQGIEPTGRRIEIRGCDCVEVEDGKITRNTAYYDGAAFARGLGLLPQTGSGGEKAMLAAFNAVTKVRSRFSSPPPSR